MPDSASPLHAHGANARVLSYLDGRSAHSDCAEILADAVRPLGDVQLFCPDPSAYRYVTASTKGLVFGFALGMGTVAFRLDERMRARAIETGGEPLPECGDEWVAVVRGRPDDDWPSVDVRFWARKAYEHARSTATADDGRGRS
jgi:hypothetical protein